MTGMAADIGIGILGAGWISRAHGLAIRTAPFVAPLGRPVRIAMLAGRDRGRAEAMARELGVDRVATDWRAVVEDPSVHVVANLMGVTGHREATEAALALGKPVLCEKPLGVDRFESAAMVGRGRGRGRAGRVRVQLPLHAGHAPGPRDRRRPARSVEILQLRAVYIQDYAAGDAPLRPHNGSRAVTDYAHIVDFLRYLGCEPEAVQATTAKLTRSGPDVEDAYVAAVDLRRRRDRLARGVAGRPGLEGPPASSSSTAPRDRCGGTWRTSTGSTCSIAADEADRDRWLPGHPRDAARPSVPRPVVAAGPHHRLGADVHPRMAGLPGRRSSTTGRCPSTRRRSRTATRRRSCAMRS